MAVKQRVLTKICGIKEGFRVLLDSDDSVDLYAVARMLSEVEDLCKSGLPKESNSLYEEVFEAINDAISEIIIKGNSDYYVDIIALCIDLLDSLYVKIEGENNFKKEIFFLPYKAEMWDSMESVWQAAKEDKDNAIPYVVPIPYCDRNPDGSAHEWRVDKFPKYVPIMDYRNVDLKVMHPDVIVIHNPYDTVNSVTSVSSEYYAANLK